MLRLRFLLRDVIQTRVVDAAGLSIGSGRENSVVLDDSAVSRRHAEARLDPEGRGIWIADTGSKNGVLVDGERVERALLLPGQAVQLGHATLQLEDVSADEAELAIELPLPAQERRESEPPTTGDLTPDLEAEPQRVIQLIRDIGAAGQMGWPTRQREFLERTLALVHAETLAIGSRGRGGEIELRLLLGSPLDEATESALGSAITRSRVAWKAHADGPLLVVRDESRRRFLAAKFARSGPASSWRVGLLEEIARGTMGDAGAEGPPRAAGHRRGSQFQLHFPPDYVLGSSALAREMEREIRLAVEHSGAALILGEPGVGKEGIAYAIHHSGPRAAKPFLVIDATKLRGELATSELFGIDKGVATNVDSRRGLIADAEDGTIFLDEIGDLGLDVQSLLLRVLQSGDYRSVGGRVSHSTSARFVSATNLDLEERERKGLFRADLHARLRATVVRVPPLRDRLADFPEILTALLHRLSRRLNRHVRGISQAALRGLMELPWPGNIRQLEYELESAILFTPEGAALEQRNFVRLRGPRVSTAALGTPELAPLATPVRPIPTSAASAATPLATELDDTRRQRVLEALRASNGNKSAAAAALRISRSTLYLYLHRLGIDD